MISPIPEMLVTFSGRPASQHPAELVPFVDMLVERGVTRYLEIGARHGDTFHYVMSRLPEGSVGVAVDLPGALWGQKSSRGSLERAARDLVALGYKASVLFGDSQTDATRRLVKGRGPFDAVLIDGDHSLVGVMRDWRLYHDIAPLAAFHDIVGTGQAEKRHDTPVEVPILWERIKRLPGAVFHEFVAPGSKMGIGVIETGSIHGF